MTETCSRWEINRTIEKFVAMTAIPYPYFEGDLHTVSIKLLHNQSCDVHMFNCHVAALEILLRNILTKQWASMPQIHVTGLSYITHLLSEVHEDWGRYIASWSQCRGLQNDACYPTHSMVADCSGLIQCRRCSNWYLRVWTGYTGGAFWLQGKSYLSFNWKIHTT
jgi:hypothetical protein